MFEMTPRRFANLSSKNASAVLAKYASFLASYPDLKETLTSSMADEKKLVACQNKILQIDLDSKMEKVRLALKEPKVKKGKKGKKAKTNKGRYYIRILGETKDGTNLLNAKKRVFDEASKSFVEHDQPMEYSANDYATAERLADRRLFERMDGLFAEITNLNGTPITTRVERRDAIARVLVKPKGAVARYPKRSADLRWRPKSHATRSLARWVIAR
jgi:hypothetical protein